MLLGHVLRRPYGGRGRGGGGRGGGRGEAGQHLLLSWLSWAERLSMRMRDCCSSSWAAPTRLLFLSADCLALSSWERGHS